MEWDFSYNIYGALAAKGEITTISVGMRFIQCSMCGEFVTLPVEINGRGTTTDIIKNDALIIAEEVLLATYLKTLIKNV